MLENSYHRIAIKILEKNGPMKANQLIREILKSKKTNGKTPEKTISTTIQRSHYIKRVQRGVYDLVKNMPSTV